MTRQCVDCSFAITEQMLYLMFKATVGAFDTVVIPKDTTVVYEEPFDYRKRASSEFEVVNESGLI